MATTCNVLTGPAGCGKTQRLLDRYGRVLAGGDAPTAVAAGATLWLAPTWRAAGELRARLLAGLPRGCFSPGVMTFDQFAESVLEASPDAVRPLGGLMKRQLIRHLLRQHHAQGRLKHFIPIAETGGLVDLLCEFISELKRLEIWPEHFRKACDARGMTQKDVELLAIYDAYQGFLRENQLYDAEGRFWSARDRLEQGQQRPLGRLRLVVADGFADFTRTQHEILEILARRAEQLWISLPLEAEPCRADLFAKPLATLAELRRRHPGLWVEECSREGDPSWPALAHLEASLFGNPRAGRPAEDIAGVEILAASGQLGEIELIGSRIKRLLTQGDELAGGRVAMPGEIAVVFRSPDDTAALVAEVFGAMGIPFVSEVGARLDRSPVLGALVALLRLDLDDWPFDGLLQVLSSNYFQPAWPEWQEGRGATAIERTIRRERVPRGRQRLLAQLEKAAGASRGDRATRPDEARATLALLKRLAAAFDALPERAGPGEWADAWGRLAGETGLLRAMASDDGEESVAVVPDRAAWARLQQALAAAEAFRRQMEQKATPWDRRQAVDALVDILSSERVGQAEDESGRVRVISATSARALRIPYLFLAGLSEKAFPPPQRVDRLYSEAEYQRLIDEGLPLVARIERSREEMLLFYEAMTRATRRLTLSYPALDASAQPLSASPFLEEVDEAAGGQIPRTVAADLSPIPTGDEPLSSAEYRVKAVASALDGDVALLAGLLGQEPEVAENLLAGIGLIDARQDRERFGPAEGMIEGDAARAWLAEKYSAEHVFGITELESYATCPFRYLLQRVLRIEPVEELALAVDYLERGQLAHEFLALFHRRVNDVLGRPASPVELDPAEYDRLLGETLDEVFGKEAPDPLRAALREVDRRLLMRWIGSYRAQHEAYDKRQRKEGTAVAPEWFEVSFGRRREDDQPPSTDCPLELFADAGPIRVAGRIDRIDTGTIEGRAVFNVVDYKTGSSAIKVSKETIVQGTTLQLPLYAFAVAELIFDARDAVPWQAGYWYLRGKGFKPALEMYRRDAAGLSPTADWEEIRGALEETVAGLVGGIRGGRFPVFSRDDECTGRCPYATVCRINHVRSLEKSWLLEPFGMCPRP